MARTKHFSSTSKFSLTCEARAVLRMMTQRQKGGINGALGAAIWNRALPTALLCLALSLLCAVIPSVAEETPEYQVKATFLYKLVNFVEWPSEAFAQENSPFVVGVLGDDPFGANLDKSVEGKSLDSHKVVVKRFKKLADLETCHMLFVSRSEKDKMSKIVERVGKANTLIIGDNDQCLPRGGTINFILEDKKVRFEINAGAADRAGLKISSKLMQLATKVVRR